MTILIWKAEIDFYWPADKSLGSKENYVLGLFLLG